MNNPKKVYVITKGIYSDYRICAVASNKKTAEHLRKYFSGQYSGDAKIEVYDLNEKIEDIRCMYRVEFRKGEVVSVEPEEYENRETISDGPIYTAIYVKAMDAEHAIKIAEDRRAEYLAKKEGVS